MSSKLIPAGQHAEARPWLPRGSAMPNPAARAQDPPPAEEMQARLDAAYQQGYASGETAGAQRASQLLEPAAASLTRIAAELAGMRARIRAEAEEDMVKLALAIARRVLHRELSTDPEAILGIVMAAFQRLNARETHRLRMHPADLAVASGHRALLSFPPGLELSADASLARGSAVFETSRGELDASIDTQLGEIERGFTDLARSRAR